MDPNFYIQPSPTGFDELIGTFIGNIPTGTFYDDWSKPIVNFTVGPQAFQLYTNNPDVPVNIIAKRLNPYALGVDQGNIVKTATIVPASNATLTSFVITLGQGLNRLVATEGIVGGRSAILDVIASTNAVHIQAMSNEMSVSYDEIVNLQNAIYSPYSTSMLDQITGVGDVLPDLQALKVLSSKMLIRSFIHFPATQQGVSDGISAVTLNTPIYVPQRGSSDFEIETVLLRRFTENAGGQEAHVWYPNLTVTRWLAFLQMANAFRFVPNLSSIYLSDPQPTVPRFSLISVADDQIVLDYKGKQQVHAFDYNSPGSNFLTNLSLTNCFSDITVTISFQMAIGIKICCWTYYFDNYITPETTIGSIRGTFDVGIPLDSGEAFDAASIDPFSNGFIGFSLSGRFDGGFPLDSSSMPSITWAGSLCSYQTGPYCQMLNTMQSNFDVQDADVQIDPTLTFMSDYVNSSGVVGVAMQVFQNPMTAGQTYLAALKFVDSNGMTVFGSAGDITVAEPHGNTGTYPLTNGFIYFELTPTQASPTAQFDLSSTSYGGLSDLSPMIDVEPAPFVGIVVSNIPNQSVGVPFSVTVSAVDVFGNVQPDVPDGNTKVAILANAPFNPEEVSPVYVDLINGTLTFPITMSVAGSGTLTFQLGIYPVTSNTFTVS